MVEVAQGVHKDGVGNDVVLTDLTKVKQLTPEELMKLVAGISLAEIEDIIRETEKITESDINPMEFNIFDYQGYDPETTIRVMLSISKHCQDSTSVLVSDIKFCIAAVLMMGNLQSKGREKRSEAGRLKLSYLCAKYGIRMGSTGTGIAAEVITFPRISSAFPSLSILMAWKLGPKTVNLDFHSAGIPSYMRLQQFNCICSPQMDPKVAVFLMEACNSYSADMSIAFEKGRQKKANKGTTRDVKYDAASIASDQWQFAEIAQNSKYPMEHQKKNLLLKLKVSDHFDVLQKAVKIYRSVCTKTEVGQIDTISKEEFQQGLTSYIAS